MAERDRSKERLDKKIADAEWKEAFHKEIVEELTNGEQYKNYFEQFSAHSVESFINDYATKKVSWYLSGDSYGKTSKAMKGAFYERAKKALLEIQQKKLFNLACQWADNEVKLDGIEISGDLESWTYKVMHCTWLQPVQDHEVDTYMQYLQQLPVEEHYFSSYDCRFGRHTFRRADDERWNDKYDYGLWFTWFDNVYGTGHLKDKPAYRIQLEEKYLDKAREQYWQNNPRPVQELRKPSLSLYSDQERFVKKYEDREYRDLFDAVKKSRKKFEFEESVTSNIWCLQDAIEHLPVASNDDWREAIRDTTELYKRGLVMEALPYVLEEYNDRIQKGKGFDDWHERNYPWGDDNISSQKNKIKEGRQLLGEPGDLNF
jgi:hypothetical protein